MPLVECNGKSVFECEITRPLVGRWTATITIDTETPPTGAVTLDTPGAVMVGTVYRPGEYAGFARVFVVGGSGGLAKQLPAKDYVGATIKTIVADILRTCGETLSSTSDAAVLGNRPRRWQRPKASGLECLQVLLRQVDGAIWRVLDDGSVWVGRPTWRATAAKLITIHEDTATGFLLLASDEATLRPGETFESREIREVIDTFDGEIVRTVAHYGRGFADAFGDAVKRFAGDLDALAQYPARVVSHSEDGLLELIPDSPKAKDLTRVPYRAGPGHDVRLSPGARVNIGFENGDRSQPYASLGELAGLKSDTVTASEKLALVAPLVALGTASAARGVIGVGAVLSVSGTSIATGPFTGTATVVSGGSEIVKV